MMKMILYLLVAIVVVMVLWKIMAVLVGFAIKVFVIALVVGAMVYVAKKFI